MIVLIPLTKADEVAPSPTSLVVATVDQSNDALQKQIDAKNSEIKRLEAEAEKYKATIATTQSQANTLQAEIARINKAVAKLQSDIKISQQRIQLTTLEIKQVTSQIGDTVATIVDKKKKLGELVRFAALNNRQSLLEIFLQDGQLSDFFNRAQASLTIQGEVDDALGELHALESNLFQEKKTSEAKVVELKHRTAVLNDQKTLQVSTREERDKILQETKNQEAKYQALLKDNEDRRSALESEINEYEKKLHITIDPLSLPKQGSGILSWPVISSITSLFQCGRNVSAFLTQCFGNTAFAKSGAYNGKGHNGIDIRADNSTEIHAADDGVVRDTGDTDIACRKASYGKWILIDHGDNLSTLYAHLSLIRVVPGQHVARGDVIAYSGHTGYATGPHLHFTVFATNAVEVGVLRSRVCGTNMTLPLSPFNGYIDPLNYL